MDNDVTPNLDREAYRYSGNGFNNGGLRIEIFRSLASLGCVTALAILDKVGGTYALLAIVGIAIPSMARSLIDLVLMIRGYKTSGSRGS